MAQLSMNINFGEYRPCIVGGRRELFHRWCDKARPALPKAITGDGHIDDHFQLWDVHAIVEFEDGTVERVWPSNVKFIDRKFDQFEWGDDLPFEMRPNASEAMDGKEESNQVD